MREASLDFEINTDAALVDPDWEAFVERHEERYGLAIHHLKSLVKGRRFDNEAMKVRVGPRGFYLQSRRFPAAFFGGTDLPEVSFVTAEEAHAIAWEAAAAYRAGDAQSLTCVYDDGDPPEVFFGYRISEQERYELGALQGGLPLHVRVMVDAQAESDLVGARQGTLVYQRTGDGRHVVLRRVGHRPPYQPMDPMHD
ncbi:MAG: hypothetical protein GVY27_01060 [Deinococcus-Thermus bacterium]|jgi:hypothetical protein|nr:hypothetical protein [Deinococcota bacterium]